MKRNFYKKVIAGVCVIVFVVFNLKAMPPVGNKAFTGYFSMADTCSPISTLPCSNINVALPYTLSFDTVVDGTIADKNGLGTGFTTVNTYSGTRLAADGQPVYSQVPGYLPSKITLTGGRLQIVSNKGIDYLTNNNQINVLGVQLTPVKKLQLDVKLINPYNGTQAQQAGLWFGLNDKTFIKITVAGNKVELRREINDVSSTTAGTSNPDQRITSVISGLNNQTVSLRLVIDSVAGIVEGFYSTDGVTFKNVGESYPSTQLNIAGTGLVDSNAYGGIYTTYRNGTSAIAYTFDDFAATSINIPVSSEVKVNFQPSGITPPSGYVADTGLPFDAGRKYGWISPSTMQPVSLVNNVRQRTGSGDIRQLTIVQMQATTSNQVPGTWEYAVTNGTYRVTVGAGDNGYYDSNHQLNIEGLPTISDFIPSSAVKYQTATATVQVTDGKLTIDANGGVNTKMAYVTFKPADAIADSIPPTASLRLSGTLKSPGVYDSDVQVFLSASDSGSGLATLQYAINGGSFINYKVPFTVTASGNYSIVIKATDGNGNQYVSNAYTFAIATQTNSGAYMVLKNMDNYPSNDRLVFSLIQQPWRRTSPDTTPYNANHDKVRLRVNNKGTARLTISSLKLSNPSVWKIVSINTDTTAATPVSVAKGTYTDITIQFMAKDASTRLKVFTDTLTITSNDSISAIKKVILSGIWQKEGEGVNEPYAQQIINAFGYATVVGYAHDDGSIDGKSTVPSSSEVKADYFVQADASKPVTVVQLAAYHGCCSAVESIRYFKKGSTSNLNIFTHNNLDGQSVLPRLIGSSTNLAQGSFTPTDTFGFRVGSSSSDRTQNYNGLIGIRFLKVFDGKGNVVPNAYFLDCDYLGTSYTNYDYQDNIYYVENIRPDSGTVHYSELVSLPNTAFTFQSTLTGANQSIAITLKNNGNTYPDGTSDPSIQIKSVQIVGPNASEFSVSGFTASTLAVQGNKAVNVQFAPATVGIKNAALLVNYNSSVSPLRIPLYGIGNSGTATVAVVKRIKGAADANVTIGNVLYEADKAYRKGSIKLDKQVILSPVAATDIDSLYQTYLSAAADLAETSYEIPLANGDYLVRMHFVENYWTGPGSRVFGINIENQLRLSNFDIYSEVGYRSALVKDFTCTVADGGLTIKFNPTANRVAIAALEIFKVNQNALLKTALVPQTLAAPLTTEKKLVVYPNPNSGSTFNLTLTNFGKNETGQLSITNISGRHIQTEKFVTDATGTAIVRVNFNNVLSRGVYMINVHSVTGKMYAKLLVE